MRKRQKRFISVIICFCIGLFSGGYLSQHSTRAGEFNTERQLLYSTAISPYDMMVREISKQTPWDWKLLLAIAHTESRFNPKIKSHRGATGLMQIMPSTARAQGYGDADLTDPKTNITVAIKVLDVTSRSFYFPEGTNPEERLKIILAAYNAGIGYVFNARKAAIAEGMAYNNWAVLKNYITRNGTHAETVGYVRKVMAKYEEYKSI